VRQEAARLAAALSMNEAEARQLLALVLWLDQPEVVLAAVAALPAPAPEWAVPELVKWLQALEVRPLDSSKIWQDLAVQVGLRIEPAATGPFHSLDGENRRGALLGKCGHDHLMAALAERDRQLAAEVLGGPLLEQFRQEQAARQAAQQKAAEEAQRTQATQLSERARRLFSAAAQVLRKHVPF